VAVISPNSFASGRVPKMAGASALPSCPLSSSSVRRLLDGTEISMRPLVSLMSMKQYK